MGGVCVEWRKNAPQHRGAPEKWADCGPLPHENVVRALGRSPRASKQPHYSRFPIVWDSRLRGLAREWALMPYAIRVVFVEVDGAYMLDQMDYGSPDRVTLPISSDGMTA